MTGSKTCWCQVLNWNGSAQSFSWKWTVLRRVLLRTLQLLLTITIIPAVWLGVRCVYRYSEERSLKTGRKATKCDIKPILHPISFQSCMLGHLHKGILQCCSFSYEVTKELLRYFQIIPPLFTSHLESILTGFLKSSYSIFLKSFGSFSHLSHLFYPSPGRDAALYLHWTFGDDWISSVFFIWNWQSNRFTVHIAMFLKATFKMLLLNTASNFSFCDANR